MWLILVKTKEMLGKITVCRKSGTTRWGHFNFWSERSCSQTRDLRPHVGATHLQKHLYAATGKRTSEGAVDQSDLRLQISSVSYICKPISDAVTLGNGLEDFQDGARKYYGLVSNKQTRCFRYKCAFCIVNTPPNYCKYVGFSFCHTFELIVGST